VPATKTTGHSDDTMTRHAGRRPRAQPGAGIAVGHGPAAGVAQDTSARPGPPDDQARQSHQVRRHRGDVQGKVAGDDLASAKARVKDLDVAWDDAEAGLKARDAVLTALRASSPTRGRLRVGGCRPDGHPEHFRRV
jgi:hypothetical protein